MPHIIYYIIIYPLSKLPYFILYRISDLLCFILKNIFRYRKRIIKGNIIRSFPVKNADEINDIYDKFYTHFFLLWN